MRGVVVLDVELDETEGFAPIVSAIQAAVQGRTDVHTAYLGVAETREAALAPFVEAMDLTVQAEEPE